MKNYFIGVNCGHNASISIVDENSNLIFSTDIDRHTRISYDFGFYENEILRAITFLGIKKKEINAISIHQVWLRDKKIFRLSKKLIPKEFYKILKKLREIDIDNLNKEKIKLLKNFKLKKFPFSKIFIASHHACHAASAGFTSPFKKTKIHVIDAQGDNLNESLWDFKNQNLVMKSKNYSYPNLPHIWELFSRLVFNQYRKDVGFKLEPYMPSKGPGKIMAIASENRPSNKIKKKIYNFGMDKDIYKLRINDPKLKKKIKKCFNINLKLNKNMNVWKKYGTFAASLQQLTNQEILKKINYNTKNLCFAGGLALNCVATSFAGNKRKIKNIYTPPFPGDSGISVGAGFLAFENYNSNLSIIKKIFYKKKIKKFTPYIGYSFDISKNFIEKNLYKKKYIVKYYDNKNELSEFVANNLLKNKIIAIFNGKAEIGPRALCNRSILSNPFNPLNKKIINKLKKREKFRPVAPTILENCAKKIFNNYFKYSPFMTQVQALKKKYHNILPGIIHSDKSARPQIINNNSNLLIKKILENIKEKMGIGVVGNTSFNIDGPIVELPIDAIKLFKKNKIDILTLNKFTVEKK